MPKIVNSWNEWDPLKRVIMGRPEGTNIPAPEPAWWRPHHRPQLLSLGGRFLPRPLRSPGRHLRVVPDVTAGVRLACWPGEPGQGKAPDASSDESNRGRQEHRDAR